MRLWLAALLLSALGVCAEFAPVDTNDAALLRSGQRFEEFVENATLSAAFSGCGLCQQTGQCDHAFRGQPGQFCIGMASGAPCCCPQDAQCAASPYECRCRRAVPTYRHGGDDYHPNSHSSGVSGTFIFFLLLLCCCVCCCYLPARRAQQAREEFAYAQPVATSQYGTYAGQQQQAPYAYASAPSAYQESGGGGNSMAAGALGALGGFGAGAALGHMFGGRDNSGYRGDAGGVSDNTYTFSGDTGGGDFGGGGSDFGGDGGDGGTFGGDS